MRRLGAVPSLVPINRAMEALSQGKLDGVTVPTGVLAEFGFSRLTNSHYMLRLGGAVVSLVMSREKLANLPRPAQEVIVKYSGEWLSEQGASCFEAKNLETASKLKADQRRTVVEPSSGRFGYRPESVLLGGGRMGGREPASPRTLGAGQG